MDKMLHADVVLTIATLCWVTKTAGSSARQYYENAHLREEPEGRGTIPPESPSFPTTFPASESDHSPNATTTSCTGRNSTAAVITPAPTPLTSSLETSVTSIGHTAQPVDVHLLERTQQP
jgi:hypothetical protein